MAIYCQNEFRELLNGQDNDHENILKNAGAKVNGKGVQISGGWISDFLRNLI